MKLILGTALALVLAGPALASEKTVPLEKKDPKVITMQECDSKILKRELELLQGHLARLEKQMAQMNAVQPKPLPKN